MEKHQQMPTFINNEWIQIDIPCVPMVLLFNSEKVNMKTQFSCQGDDKLEHFEIIFDKEVTDENIVEFLCKFEEHYTHSPFMGRFLKWTRKLHGKIVSNWTYNCMTIEDACKDFEIIKNKFEGVKN